MFGIKDCILKIDEALSDVDKQTIMSTPKNDLSSYHHGLGRWIRNECELWKLGTEKIEEDYQSLMDKGYHSQLAQYLIKEKLVNENNDVCYDLSHPDNASGIIIEIYYDYLNRNFDINLLD